MTVVVYRMTRVVVMKCLPSINQSVNHKEGKQPFPLLTMMMVVVTALLVP